MKQNCQKGFTFVEGLVVLAVLGLIAVIVGVQTTNYLNKANIEGATAEVRTFLESAKSAMVRENSPITVRYQLVNNRPSLLLLNATGATLSTLRLPDYVKAAVNPGGAAPSTWPAPTAGNLFTCDTQGRTLAASGLQVPTTQVLALTHKGMVGEGGFVKVEPRMRYDVEVYPLWTVNVRRTMF